MSDVLFKKKKKGQGEGRREREKERNWAIPMEVGLREHRIRKKYLINHKFLDIALQIDMESKLMSLP